MLGQDMHDWRYIITADAVVFWQCGKCMLIACTASGPEGEAYSPQLERPCLYA